MERPAQVARDLEQGLRMAALLELNEKVASLLAEQPSGLITMELGRVKQIMSRLLCELGLADEIV